MKATLSFNLPEEQTEFDAAVKSLDMSIALDEISNEVFRPARKHGYSDPEITSLLESLGDKGVELISLLEQKYIDVLNVRNLL